MLKINFPLFKIPDSNKINDKKGGWWSAPKFYGDEKQFEEMKRQRVGDVDAMLNIAQRTDPFNEKLHDKAFFEMKFHPKALAKSAQPRKLLESYNIDIYAHKKEGVFFASSTIKNLAEFRNGISTFSIQRNKNESSMLSAITDIKPIEKEEIGLQDIKEKQKVFIYLHDSISQKEWESIYKDAVEKYNLSDTEFFVSNSNAKILYGIFPSSFLDAISEPVRWPAQKIEPVYDIQVSQSEVSSYDFNGIEVEEPLLDAKVVVVDSWMHKHHFMKDLIINSLDLVKNESKTDRYHWTMVWSRVLFWNSILDDLKKHWKLTAQAKVFDLHIMSKQEWRDFCTVNPKELVDALKKVIVEHIDSYRVYNLSLNFWHPCTQGKDFLTKELDALSQQYGVLFVVSAGNQKTCLSVTYPDCLEENDSRIATPADGVNVLSVWSVTDNESLKSMAKDSEPSPFTRTWLADTKKPDVVHYWGNLDRHGRANWLGIIGFGNEKDKIIEDIWTSFSAPLVSQIAAKIYAYLQTTDLWNNPPIELVKALVLHSSHYDLPTTSTINELLLNQYVGHWIPDFMRAINSFKNTATFIYTWVMWELTRLWEKEQAIDKHKIILDIPKELAWKDKKVKVKGTLVYLCPISSSWEYDYTMSDISINISYLNSKGHKASGNLTSGDKDHRMVWNPIKTFEKTYTAYQWGQWEILLQYLVRWELDPKSFQQRYALIISIEDVSEWEQIDLHELISTRYNQYVPLKQKVKTEQKVK